MVKRHHCGPCHHEVWVDGELRLRSVMCHDSRFMWWSLDQHRYPWIYLIIKYSYDVLLQGPWKICLVAREEVMSFDVEIDRLPPVKIDCHLWKQTSTCGNGIQPGPPPVDADVTLTFDNLSYVCALKCLTQDPSLVDVQARVLFTHRHPPQSEGVLKRNIIASRD